jgi:hypothetical protein
LPNGNATAGRIGAPEFRALPHQPSPENSIGAAPFDQAARLGRESRIVLDHVQLIERAPDTALIRDADQPDAVYTLSTYWYSCHAVVVAPRAMDGIPPPIRRADGYPGAIVVADADESNELLARARSGRLSPSGSGYVMSRQELAEAINEYLWTTYRVTNAVDATYVGHLEQGRYRWPGRRRREAFRRVLGVATDAELGFYPTRGKRPSGLGPIVLKAPPLESNGPWHPGDIDRRTMLRSSLAAAGWVIPDAAVTLDDLRRIVAALEDSRRYLDTTVVGHLAQSLDVCATDDGILGPRAALPGVLGVIGVIEQRAVHVKPHVRRELLALGARAAEFAGWLYRDAGMPQPADHWRDRATEWGLESGNFAMLGYVLIKKSQSAWDARDALRMLTLAQAVQQGPWELPPRVKAEALQQEARGHAMIDGNTRRAHHKLDQARELLASKRSADSTADGGLAAHYDASLFEVQTAMCYAEGGQPERAVSIYDSALSPTVFSRRDYAYFLVQKGQALAATGRPDDAARTGQSALPIATAAGSRRTIDELLRLSGYLQPWAGRPAVREFRELLAV